jgi:hypothetical protein
MNIIDELGRDEQRVLDRLVDGELSPIERRELLAALDDESGAWRRCALAFLEAQTWRWQMSRLAVEPLIAAAPAAESAAAESIDAHPAGDAGRGRSTHWPLGRRFWGSCLAVAASLIVAFGLGTRFPQAPQDARNAEVAEPNRGPLRREATTELAQLDPDSLGEFDPDSLDQSPWETLTLAPADAEDGSQQIEIPVVREGTNDEQWAAIEQSASPAQLLRELEKTGLQVIRQQRLWPVDLADGRRLIVPIEEVDVRDPEVVRY